MQSKKRRTDDGSDSDESEPEVKLNDDDLVGLDTSNIIPRARRRAAAAAMATSAEELNGGKSSSAPAAAKADDDDGESSDEAEF